MGTRAKEAPLAAAHLRDPTRRRPVLPPRRRRAVTPRPSLTPTYFFGQGILMVVVDFSPLRNVSSVFAGKPPFGHLVGTVP